MLKALNTLPNDVDVLKALVTQQAQQNKELEVKVSLLQEQLNQSLSRHPS